MKLQFFILSFIISLYRANKDEVPITKQTKGPFEKYCIFLNDIFTTGI